jgi:hypothetical protein
VIADIFDFKGNSRVREMVAQFADNLQWRLVCGQYRREDVFDDSLPAGAPRIPWPH